MMGRWYACTTVAMFCAMAGSAAAQPTAAGLGLIDDRVVNAAKICASDVLRIVNVELATDGAATEQNMKSPKLIKKWCGDGDLANLTANAGVLRAAIAYCESQAAQREPDSACSGDGKLTLAVLQKDPAARYRLAGPKEAQEEASTRRFAVPTAGVEAVTTTTDIVARAVASFLEKRARAEFKEFILRRLHDRICEKAELGPWLPNTCAYLAGGIENTTLPLSIGAGLRAALVQDAVGLPERVIAILLTPETGKVGDAEMLLTRAGFEIALSLLNHRDPLYIATILDRLAADPRYCSMTAAELADKVARSTEADCINIKTLFAVIARAMTTERTKQLDKAGAIDFDFASQVFVNELGRELRTHPPNNAVGQRLFAPDRGKTLITDAGQPGALLAAAQALARATAALGAAIDAPIEQPDGETAHFREVANRAAAVITEFDALVAATSDLIPDGDVRKQLSRLHDELVFARSLVGALIEADLAQLVSLTATRLGPVLPGMATRHIRIPPEVVRVVSFAVDLATAKDPKEAEAVIEGVAAPPHAWQGKLEDTVFSLSGFVGGTVGTETTRTSGADVRTSSVGPIAALGLDINLPGRLSPWLRKGVRPGLFLSVIDVGALMTYSFDTPSQSVGGKSIQAGSTTPVGFAQIFSPGAFLRLGISNTPLVLGAGLSFLPRGRSITTTDGGMTTSDDRSAVRWSAFMAIDVTLLPL